LKNISTNREQARQEERDQSFNSISTSHIQKSSSNDVKNKEQIFKAPNKIAKLIKSRQTNKEKGDDES
jgi:hypothetical protein